MPEASATQKGVENPRRAALADISKNRTEALAAELKEGGSSAEDIASITGTPADVPTDDQKRPQDISPEDWGAMSDEEKGNAISAAATATETDEQRVEREKKEAEAIAAPATEKLKIDGQEQDVGVDKIMDAGRRALQKELAADKRLEEATKARDEAERLRKQVEDTIARAGHAAPAKKTDQEMIVAKEGLRDIVKKIQYGSEEEAAQALEQYGKQMAELGQTGRLTESELHNILDLREAQKYVKTEFADVMGDANLKELFVGKVNKKLAAGDARPYQEICKETGDELRAWRAPAKADPTPTGGSRAAAAQRKTTTVSIPVAGARLPAAPTETLQDKPLAQRVDDINKSRGRST